MDPGSMNITNIHECFSIRRYVSNLEKEYYYRLFFFPDKRKNPSGCGRGYGFVNTLINLNVLFYCYIIYMYSYISNNIVFDVRLLKPWQGFYSYCYTVYILCLYIYILRLVMYGNDRPEKENKRKNQTTTARRFRMVV